ncbi:MAG TPA: membrane dipeptidase [Phycisphaerales bacterium]|nr:membrane dipeptidase [Phycisphaerales bacterium]
MSKQEPPRSGGVPKWFDAHLDLAYLAVLGRDMLADPASAGGPDLPGCVTLPSLRDGGVTACLGTVFTELGAEHAAGYKDAECAHRAGLRQIEVYQAWEQGGQVELLLSGGSQRPPRSGGVPSAIKSPDIGILVEGADPISDPDELSWWVEQGVVAVGLAWAKGSRYAGGNTQQEGLTDIGRALIAEMDRLDVTHDVSHLSDRAFAELMDLARGSVMASHSNCRALIDEDGQGPTQRHLTDAQIRAVVQRGGMIGLNLYSPFLIRGGRRDRRATISEAVDHVEHVCMMAGGRSNVGLGSDMDGGFSAAKLPEGIDLPRDLVRLAEELARRGWSDADIQAFAWGNWARFWGIP